MAWINIASTRFRLREEAEYLMDKLEFATEPSLSPKALMLRCLQTGDRTLATRAKALAHRLLALFYGDIADGDLLYPEVLPEIVGLSIVAHIDGADQTALWERIAKANSPPEPVMRALKGVVACLLDAPTTLTGKKQIKSGHVYRESDWINLLKKEDLSRLFDLASSPDHPLWGYTLDSFVLPLGLLLHRELLARGDDAPDIHDLFRLGSYPWRHPNVVYERQQERPDPLSIPDPDKQDTWFGFDAIEIRDHQAYVYHYLGLSWQAPLLFEKDANAFYFLESSDLSWKLVETSLPLRQWQKIKNMRDRDDCVHIVVHDSTKAQSLPHDLAQAGKYYGVKLEARDLMLV